MAEPLSSLKVGPQVRIRLPPGASPLRTIANGHTPKGVTGLRLLRAANDVPIGEPAARAAQRATTPIAIIAAVNDLVASGLIASLAVPGGSITGESRFVPELDAENWCCAGAATGCFGLRMGFPSERWPDCGSNKFP